MTAMTKEEREHFLREVRIGVLSVVEGDGQGPLTVPVGYVYTSAGEVVFTTARDSRKMDALRSRGRAGFLVQDEQNYRYVSVEGELVGESPTTYEEHLSLSVRYLGPEQGRQFCERTEDSVHEMVTVTIRPRAWRSYDFGKA
ncbi:pyridoxamine 5'-phosphate oxidase [Nocardiopsis kunsanensis]|uniref:Pyridoxamine 5'-phosphate oxidase n=1 Tax=Nocardiopsis kunsanensis TaxID=141693 RepID=A0A918X856_9ACTN|nr:pyridoxamine 5'-phosphate oxidase family protein [Nocardiopsis kunsanensis]GHD17730.1 pyridoxamine 5'-phosphate oxidase [Nocardiopsis kunsanensis]